MKRKELAVAAAAAVAAGMLGAGHGTAHAAPITPGNLLVYRVGTGTGALTSGATAAFVDEYTQAGTLVQSFPLPTDTSGSATALTAAGTATSEGFLNLSTDGQFVTLTGYDATVGTASVAGTTSAAVPRVVGRLGLDGTVDLSTRLTDAYSGGNVRSAVSTDGTRLYTGGTGSGATGGFRTTTLGGPTSTQLAAAPTNTRVVDVFGSQLFGTSGSGTARLGTIGDGTPTASGQTFTNLPGITDASSGTVAGTLVSPYAFFLADLDESADFSETGLDTLYVADDGRDQVVKFTFNGSSFVEDGAVAAINARGLTGFVNDAGTVTLFATLDPAAVGGVTPEDNISRILDASGFDGTLTSTPVLVATAATNTAFRGVEVVPIPEPAGLALLACGGGLLTLRRRRR